MADTNDLWIMSFNSPCCECRPWLHLQLRPWVAYWSTSSPHVQWTQACGALSGHPNLRPTAILTASSSNLRPREETGKVCNHEPDSLADTERRHALDLASLVDDSSALSSTLGVSHAFILKDSGGEGGVTSGPTSHWV